MAEVYLRARGITQMVPSSTLRFHPKCWHRDEGRTKPVPRPALIAAVTDGAGVLQGVHRTWLAPDGKDKAAVDTPRRAMGHILGNAVRIVPADQTLVLGEGIETMLSVREAAPSLPVWAALSSSHLGAVLFPVGLQRLYIAIDRDPAGQRAAERLTARLCGILCPGAFCYAIGKRSSNMMASWLLTACHSRTERFHSVEVALSAR